MARAGSDQHPWKVFSHGSLAALGPNLWQAEGTMPGNGLGRRMVVARMADGERLVVHNGVCLDEAAMAELEALGEVAFVLVPNGFHRFDAARFQARYPRAKFLCPEGATGRVKKLIEVDGTYADLPKDTQVALQHVRGVKAREGVMVVQSGGERSLVFNDLVMNLPHTSGPMGFILKHITRTTGGPKVSGLAKMLFVANGAEAATHMAELCETTVSRIVPGHGAIIDAAHQSHGIEAPDAVLRRIADAIGPS